MEDQVEVVLVDKVLHFLQRLVINLGEVVLVMPDKREWRAEMAKWSCIGSC